MHELEQAQLVRNHFDEVSDAWGRLYTKEITFSNYNFLVRKRHVLELFDKHGGRFLDAGCGTGDFIPDLLERGGEVYAVDFAQEMVDKARSQVPGADAGRVHFSVGDVCNLTFESNFFDAIIGVGLLEYLADLEGALAQMYRVLKPGGILIATVPNIASPFMAYETLVPKCKGVVKGALAALRLREPERAYFQRHFLPWQLDRQLKHLGYRKADYSFCTFGFFSERRLEGFSLRMTAALDKYNHVPVGILGTNYIVKAQKPAAS